MFSPLGLTLRHDGYMRRSRVIALICGVLIAGVGIGWLIYFFASQGLTNASLWATVMGFGFTAVGTVGIVWTLVLIIRQGKGESEDRDKDDGRRGSAPVRQVNSSGTNIAHSGEGDINYHGSAK